ncbi:MAG: hypothetical protein ACYDDV_11860, partial [Methanoregula sp.]
MKISNFTVSLRRGVLVTFILLLGIQCAGALSSPVPYSPGTSSEPGQQISTTTPTLSWSSVSGADYYAVAISKYPYGSSNIVYNQKQVYGTSIAIPGGTLVAGEKYRWNMQAHNSAGWSSISSTLYFYTQASTPPTTTPTPSAVPSPSSPVPYSPGTSSEPGQQISTTTPTLSWSSVSGADYYAVAVSKYPYGSNNIVYNQKQVYGTS